MPSSYELSWNFHRNSFRKRRFWVQLVDNFKRKRHCMQWRQFKKVTNICLLNPFTLTQSPYYTYSLCIYWNVCELKRRDFFSPYLCKCYTHFPHVNFPSCSDFLFGILKGDFFSKWWQPGTFFSDHFHSRWIQNMRKKVLFTFHSFQKAYICLVLGIYSKNFTCIMTITRKGKDFYFFSLFTLIFQ